jgi:TetR/AcrR family transcriptional regulator
VPPSRRKTSSDGSGEERTRDPERTKARILKAATDLFMKRGPTGCSLDDISKEAGVNRGLIYHYFRTKDTLFDHVVARPLADFIEVHLEFLQRGPLDLEGLRSATASFFRFLARHPELVRLLGWLSLVPRVAVDVSQLELTKSLHTRVVKRIEDAQSEGLLRREIPAAHLLISIVDLCLGWHLNRAQWVEKLASGARDRKELDEERLAAILDLIAAAARPAPAAA